MAISNGALIEVSDLNGAFSSQLTSLQSENATLPVCYRLNVDFVNCVGGGTPTAAAFLTKNVVIPDDSIIHEIAVCGGEHNGVVTITIDSGALITPITITGTLGTNFQKLTRYYSTTTNPLQMLLKGSVLSLTLSTTNTVATSNVQITLMLLSQRRIA